MDTPMNVTEQLEALLSKAGAIKIKADSIDQNGDKIEVRFFKLAGKIVATTEGLRDGPSFRIAPNSLKNPVTIDADWKSVFSFTVDHYDDMTMEEWDRWNASIPHGRGFGEFLLEHIDKFLKIHQLEA
jgi:hypothetical protein